MDDIKVELADIPEDVDDISKAKAEIVEFLKSHTSYDLLPTVSTFPMK